MKTVYTVIICIIFVALIIYGYSYTFGAGRDGLDRKELMSLPIVSELGADCTFSPRSYLFEGGPARIECISDQWFTNEQAGAEANRIKALAVSEGITSSYTFVSEPYYWQTNYDRSGLMHVLTIITKLR